MIYKWFAIDGGHPQIYGGITLTPRARLSFPLDFKIQFSNDAFTWTDIPEQSYSNYGNDGSPHTFTFKKPVMARYIRVYATKLGRDDRGGYYFQLAGVKAHLSTIATSSSLEGWEAFKLIDGNTGSSWSSHGHQQETETEWIALNLGNSRMVGGVHMYPRATLGFPREFRIQYSNDALNWSDIPGQSYTHYVNDGSMQAFTFINPVIARYVRVYATKLGADDMGNYYFQLNELQAVPSKIWASSSLEGWEASKLIDGNPGSSWSSHGHPEERATEWIALDLETVQSINRVHLSPRGTLSFPKDFKIQTSSDASAWTDVPGQSYSNYINNGSVQIFNFQTPVNARYVRVYATKLGRDDMGNYYFQLNEFSVE